MHKEYLHYIECCYCVSHPTNFRIIKTLQNQCTLSIWASFSIVVICLFMRTEIKIWPPTGISFACYVSRQSHFLDIDEETSNFIDCLAFQKVFEKVYHQHF